MGVGARWGRARVYTVKTVPSCHMQAVIKLGKLIISKHPLATVWYGTTLTSHQSEILHSLIFICTWLVYLKFENCSHVFDDK